MKNYEISKTPYASYCLKDFDVAKGCKLCVEGKKLVLFITGICSRNCFYCSLSEKRKNKDIVWANERICKKPEDAIQEAKESHSEGAGITGGDPLMRLNRTIKYAKALKKEFGKDFHIHIYLPTDNIDPKKLKLLSSVVDEVRFHPYFLNEESEKEIEKIKLANSFFSKDQIGVEMPLLPDKTKEILEFIKKVSPYIGFVNLNELEISDSNFDYVTENYKINEDTYTVFGSLKEGIKILKACRDLPLKIHVCSARTKNFYQYKNRLLLHDILPFGYKTKEGSVRYFVILLEDLKKEEKEILDRFEKDLYFDKRKNRFIVNEKIVPKLLEKGIKIMRVEELPTYDALELQSEYV